MEWAGAFKAEFWEKVNRTENPAVKEGEALLTAGGGNLIRAEVSRKGMISPVGSHDY